MVEFSFKTVDSVVSEHAMEWFVSKAQYMLQYHYHLQCKELYVWCLLLSLIMHYIKVTEIFIMKQALKWAWSLYVMISTFMQFI